MPAKTKTKDRTPSEEGKISVVLTPKLREKVKRVWFKKKLMSRTEAVRHMLEAYQE